TEPHEEEKSLKRHNTDAALELKFDQGIARATLLSFPVPQCLRGEYSYCIKPPGSFLAVPPTVSRSSFVVGMPTPTGTAWPSLPQVPMPSSSRKSLPTIETCFKASGPLPINVAPRIGAVTWPSSIM